MKAHVNLFWILAVFFLIMAGVYVTWSLVDPNYGTIEWAGTTALTLSAILAAFVGFYLSRVFKHQGGPLPEDTLTANIDDGDPELGHFSPWSWWPIILAAGGALMMLGLSIGFWISYIAAPLLLIAVVGWTYEYYRGFHAR
ncbi:cytochrome c oxidase subunit 4 [Mycetocola zhadangensis]|uniref:Cytochrome c oxidase polypeptide 4 n=1 Tax=Mycetocola zhadangensis TaxID=1164595 RepID=A0A3L7J6N2_9MICO|nr:cytochrome c oxidase subunit 4 [Mycetocola zhadangensis]RLQ86266.1 cytochrome c oxidase subunit 4 [Mycetocola zhadangensis]GGE89728.1 putative cytochrome c oxidase polypeptide 4 [Mycetocola zhadangensis]